MGNGTVDISKIPKSYVHESIFDCRILKTTQTKGKCPASKRETPQTQPPVPGHPPTKQQIPDHFHLPTESNP